MTFKHVLLGAAILAGTSRTAFSAAEYFNQAAFQTAIIASGQNPLAPITFDPANYTPYQRIQDQHGDQYIATSTSGFPITIKYLDNDGFGASPALNGNTLAGIFISFHDSLVLTFGTPIYAFRANFTLPLIDANPTDAILLPEFLADNANSYVGLLDVPQSGFAGFISDTPFTSLFIDNGNCSNGVPQCGSSVKFSMSDFVVSTSSTPEPNFGMAIPLFGLALFFVRRHRSASKAEKASRSTGFSTRPLSLQPHR